MHVHIRSCDHVRRSLDAACANKVIGVGKLGSLHAGREACSTRVCRFAAPTTKDSDPSCRTAVQRCRKGSQGGFGGQAGHRGQHQELLQAKERTTCELLQANRRAEDCCRPKRRARESCCRPKRRARAAAGQRELLQANRELLQAKEESKRELLQGKDLQLEATRARDVLESQVVSMKSQMARYAVERDTECSALYARVIIEWFELTRGIEQPRGKGWEKFLEENPEFKNMLDTTCGEQFDGDWHAGAKKAYTILSTQIHNTLPVLRGDNIDERILRLPDTMPTWIGCLVRVLAEDLMHMKLAVQFVSTEREQCRQL